MAQASGVKEGYRLCRQYGDVVPVNGTVYASREDPRLERDLARALTGTDPGTFPDRWPFALVPMSQRMYSSPVTAIMMRHADARIEGWWRDEEDPSKSDMHYVALPWPEARVAPWKGMDEFLGALDVVERSTKTIQKHQYMGTSWCRICGCNNGTGEFYDAREFADHGWRWPMGLRHYIAEHNVEPSVAFQCYVIWRSRNLRCS